MFGRIFLARAYEAARPSLDWRSAVDYGERVVDGERFLFSYCRFCGERLAGASLRRHDRTRATRKLRFSVEHHLHVGCPAQPPERTWEQPRRCLRNRGMLPIGPPEEAKTRA